MNERRARPITAAASGESSSVDWGSEGPDVDMQDSPAQDDGVHYTVDAQSAGGRLDAVLAGLHGDLSRSRLKELILAGAVAINGATICEPRHKVKPGDRLTLVPPPPEDAAPWPEAIPLDVFYEDAHLIVLDKPPGLVVHPAPGSPTGTLVNALIHHCGDSLAGIGGERRPGIVHRLDKDTSGVLVAAKTEKALNHLAAQFADHGRTGPLVRSYTAYVWQWPEPMRGTVDAPIGRDAHNRLKQAVRKDGRDAVTHYATKARFAGEGWTVARLACRLETGRTHQIRVHMAHIRHPLLADPLYASGFATKRNKLPSDIKELVDKLGRQALHAAELGFAHPETGETMRFTAPPPHDLAALDAALDAYQVARGKRP